MVQSPKPVVNAEKVCVSVLWFAAFTSLLNFGLHIMHYRWKLFIVIAHHTSMLQVVESIS